MPQGKTLSLADFAGRLVLVNLWATWCAPCRKEMPSLERLQTRLGDKIAILAISEDSGGEKAVAPFVARLGLTALKIYLDPKSAVGHAFKVDGLPTSFLIDRQGRVAGPGRGRGRLGFAKDAGDYRAAAPAGARSSRRPLRRRIPNQHISEKLPAAPQALARRSNGRCPGRPGFRPGPRRL